MQENIRVHKPRAAWLALGIVLLLLAAASAALVRQHHALDLDSAHEATQRELTLIASLVTTELQQGNYQEIDRLLREWGESNADVLRLQVTAPNGFVLGQYRKAAPDDPPHTVALESAIRYSYRSEASVSLRKDLGAVYRHRDGLAAELAVAFVVVGGLLAYLLHLLLRRQRETLILRRRTAELHDANAALERENTERRRAEGALFEAKERAEVTLHSIGDAVITADATGRVEYLNPVAEQLTGWSTAEARGRALAEVFRIVNEHTGGPADDPVARVLREGVIVGLANHTVLVTRDGGERAIEDSAAPIRDRSGQIAGVVLVFHDVSASRELAHQLTWQASHDALTGLINRREFDNRLQRALASAHGEDQHHALLYIDLDQFKVVNDTCGHIAGDELLKQLSAIKQEHLRMSDTLARLGGDEFGVLLESGPIERAQHIAESLREVIKGFRFAWEGKTFEVSASIGLVPIHAGSGGLAQLMSAADMACYAAKEAGRNRIHLYREADAELIQRHSEMLWVARLTEALEQDRFVLYRQAIVPAVATAPVPEHYEILLRLPHDDGSVIAPGSFIPAAERYNLMPAIDRWVVRALLTAEATADPAADRVVAVNLSGASLGDERFLDFVRDELRRHQVPPGRLCFEITETTAISNLARATLFIKELRALGCCFALDDFGSGLSSFGYLKNLPVDYLKIDGSLVRNIADNPIDLAMVEAINRIGHVMGMRTIAEFVENDTIREKVCALGIDYVQGYGIEYPRPLAP